MSAMLHRQRDAQGRRGPIVRSDEQDEARLIARIAAGERRAFEALYRLYHPRLSRFLINILHRPHLAEEALNDTMLVVWRRPEAYNGTSKVSTWVFAIAYRTALKALSRHEEPMEDPFAERRASGETSAERRIEERQAQATLLEAMGRLSPDHRAVVDLTYFHEAGYREIAEIMDCPVGTVKTRMHHARLRLREMLAGQLEDWL